MRKQIEDFQRIIEVSKNADDGGESTENEEEEDELSGKSLLEDGSVDKNISVEVNDL